MLKKMFIITATLLCGFGLKAQNPFATENTVIKGENGAKTVILGKATGAYPEFLSEDANFLCGMFGGGYGYFYDFKKDTCVMYMESTLAGYISDDHYVGQDDPGEPMSNSYTFYEGTKHMLEKTLPDTKGAYGEVSVWAVQGNGDRISTMAYEEYTRGNGTIAHYNIALVHDGKTGNILHRLPFVWSPDLLHDDDKISFGSRGDCISGDGMIIGGHSSNPNAKSNWSLAFWDISDPNDIKAFGLGSKDNCENGIEGLNDRSFGFGSFYGTNYDGSVLVGGSESNSKGVILYYDRTNKVVTKIDTIAPLVSWDFTTFTDVSNTFQVDGKDELLVIGYCGMSLDPSMREAVVYTNFTGLIKMTDFLYEYYNIDARRVDLYTPIKISRDGKRIVGFDNSGLYPVPYSHELSDVRILPRARQITARAYRGEERTKITWQKPFKSKHTLIGYNVYRDENAAPINATMIPATTEEAYEYEDKDVKSGKHTYYIAAVYNDGDGEKESGKQPSNTVQVVGPGMSFPVQALDHRTEYNRYATLYWGLPSSEVAALAKNDIVTPGKEAVGKFEYAVENVETPATETATVETMNAPRPKSYANANLDYIANVDLLAYNSFCAVKVNDDYYTTSWQGGGITVINQFNEVVKIIYPNDLGIVLSMYYDKENNWLYCGTSQDIKLLDLNTIGRKPNTENIDTAKILEKYPFPARFLAYVDDIDDQGTPGFVAGGIHECNTYIFEEGMDGDIAPSIVPLKKNYLNFGSLYAQGAAYYDGKLYVSSATGPYYNEVHVFDFMTKERIGEPIQVVEDPALFNLLTLDGNEYLVANMSTVSQAGGLSIVEMDDDITALGMVFQCNYMTARFMLLELENANVNGYTLYRSVDGGKPAAINSTPLKSRRYPEELTQAGKYTYYVTVNTTSGESEQSPCDTIVITDQGNCPQPELTIKESNGWAVLNWMPVNIDQAIVGCDLYRGGKQLGRFWLNDLRLDYIDDEITELGTYTYQVKVLYEEGCVSEKTASITLTGEGFAKEPFGLSESRKLNNDLSTYNVTLKWETPLFEDPLALRFCNGMAAEVVGFDNFYECWGVIGWSEKDLNLYRDLYLVGMEFMVGETPKLYEAIVIVDDEIIYKQAVDRPIARAWQTVWFDQSFPMDQKQEIAVGFHTKYDAESAGVLVVDPTVTSSGGNIISLDGFQWSTLQAGGVAGNWYLSALVADKRQLDAAKNADGTINGTKLAGSVMRMALEAQPLNAKIETMPNQAFTVKPSAKAALDLKGFNVYRKLDGADDNTEIQLNDELMTEFELTDLAVKATEDEHEYDYAVSAVYADGQEIRATIFVNLKPVANEDESELLSLSVYPNPATQWINVEGEYEMLQIFDLGGRMLRTYPAAAQIQLDGLKPGTYMLHFTGANARKAVYKIVVR